MTPAEREFLLKHMADGRDTLLRAITGLTHAQLSFQTQPDRWSIADCVEHIALTEDTMFVLAANGQANPAGVPLEPEKYERFATAVVERRRRVLAPEHMRPAHRFSSVEQARDHFLAGRDRAIAYVNECSQDVRHLFASHPLLGEIDCYRFLLLLALHPARHAVQIEEIKNDPAFPTA